MANSAIRDQIRSTQAAAENFVQARHLAAGREGRRGRVADIKRAEHTPAMAPRPCRQGRRCDDTDGNGKQYDERQPFHAGIIKAPAHCCQRKVLTFSLLLRKQSLDKTGRARYSFLVLKGKSWAALASLPQASYCYCSAPRLLPRSITMRTRQTTTIAPSASSAFTSARPVRPRQPLTASLMW